MLQRCDSGLRCAQKSTQFAVLQILELAVLPIIKLKVLLYSRRIAVAAITAEATMAFVRIGCEPTTEAAVQVTLHPRSIRTKSKVASAQRKRYTPREV